MKTSSKQLHKLAKLWALNGHDKWLLGRVLGVLTVYRGLLLVVPFNRFVSTDSVKSTAREDLPQKTIDELVWAINLLSANVPAGFTCLVQALAIRWLLKNHSDIQLHIGVRKSTAEGFSAHAWVSYKGRTILGEQANQAFEPILQWN